MYFDYLNVLVFAAVGLVFVFANLIPWAMVLRDAFDVASIGYWALAKGFLFVSILFFGLIAVWAKGDLDWVLSYQGSQYVPTARREAKPIPTVEQLTPDDAGGHEEGSKEEEAA